MILDGKVVAKEIRENIKNEKKNNDITLAIIVVGDNSASGSYIKGVIKTSEKIGINVKLVKFSTEVTNEELIEKIKLLNNDDKINGIMIQMPLPETIDNEKVINSISYSKDVDCLTDINMGKLIKGKDDGFIPCTPLAILELIDFYDIDVTGLDVSVIGRSNIVGKPIAGLLTNRGATVTICHSRTKNIKEKVKKSDIVIVAVGKKHFLTKDMVSEKAIIIDVGINVENGKLYGDVDYDNLKENVKAITPVPGGIGSITNTLLVKNTIKSFLSN